MVDNTSLVLTNKDKKLFMQIAAWLIDKTSLTFYQIAQCCKLDCQEVQDIADGELDIGEYNPIASGIITEKEINKCSNDASQVPTLNKNITKKKGRATSNAFGFTPAARRRDKPDGIYYLIKKYDCLDYNAIARLIATTINTVEKIANGSHANMTNIKPQDPVLLGLCSQKDLEDEVERAEVAREKQERLKNIKNDF